MRLVVLGLAVLALAACGDRRSFDQRYEDTSARLEEKARSLDANLAENRADGNESQTAD